MLKKSLSVFFLVMINLAAMGGIKSWPLMAVYGFSSLFFILLAALLFFIPSALVSAELATGWPALGGVFVWVKKAFGHRTGFLAIWLLWLENVVWYPTILAFIAATLAYLIDPALTTNKFYQIAVTLVIFWSATCANLRGIKTSSWISTTGVILGTFIPAAFIIGLGLLWSTSGKPLQITFTSFVPSFSSPDQFAFFTGILFAFCGIEMSAIHANDVRSPQRDYPRATLISSLLLVFLTAFGVLAIASVLPPAQISLTSGSLQAIALFVDAYSLHDLIPIIALLITIGAIASLSTWIIGPSRGLLAAAKSGDLPPFLRKVNKHGMPVNLLLFQALIVTALTFLLLFMPSVDSLFWMLTAMTAQAYLIMYILMFAAALKLRYKEPLAFRAYKIPGGIVGIWIVSGLGILTSLAAFLIGFFPPAQIATGNETFFFAFLLCGIALICAAPSLILLFKKPSWEKPLPHEQEE